MVPGYFINEGELEATSGNTLTLAVGPDSELFNPGLIVADGGSVLITGTAGAIVGGFAPVFGVALIEGGGTIEDATGFPTTTAGGPPFYVFADTTAGNTLKIDQPGSFAGRIVNFQAGDTIDLGSPTVISKVVPESDGRVLLENSGGTIIDTLAFSTGSYAASNLLVSTGTDGDTILTTTLVDPNWAGGSGFWQTATGWSTDQPPGATDAAFIGLGATAPFVLTTGSLPVVISALTEASGDATLEITSNVTVGASSPHAGVIQFAGTLEITAGNTLTTPSVRQLTQGGTLLVDAGGTLDILGKDNFGFPNAGTITVSSGNSVGMFVEGTAIVDGVIDAGNVSSNGTVVSPGGFIAIGEDSTGSPAVMIVRGGSVVDTFALLSSDPTSFGSLVLTGTSTVWNDASDSTDTQNTRGYIDIGGDNQAGNTPLPPAAGTASLLVENGATLVEATYALIGQASGSSGSATIASGGLWNIGTSAAGGFLTVGQSAGSSGTLSISGGAVRILSGTGTIVVNGATSSGNSGLSIGQSAGSAGTVTVANGFLSNAGANIRVGQSGTGILDVVNGGTVSVTGTADGISIGRSAGATGSMTVSGANAFVTIASGNLTIGQAGTGSLNVQSGGLIEVNGTSGVSVGQSANAIGLLEVGSAGTLYASGNAGITAGGPTGATGSIDVNGGLIYVSGGGSGVGNAGSGVVSVENHGTIYLTSTSVAAASVGSQAHGSGTILVQNNGSLLLTDESLIIAGGSSAAGTVVVSGAGSALLQQNSTVQTPNISVGQSGAGLLEVAAGAAVTTPGFVDIGGFGTVNLAASGTVTVAGGLIVNSGTTSFVNSTLTANSVSLGDVGQSTGTLLVGAGGTVDVTATNGFGGVTVGSAAQSTGSLDVNGGLLAISGAGLTVGNAGTGVVSVENGGTISSAGTSFASVTVGSQTGS